MIDFLLGWAIFMLLFGPVLATLLVFAGIGLLFWKKFCYWLNPPREED